MDRLHAPNEFLRIRRLREGMRAGEELWRPLADGPRRLASRQGGDGYDAMCRAAAAPAEPSTWWPGRW